MARPPVRSASAARFCGLVVECRLTNRGNRPGIPSGQRNHRDWTVPMEFVFWAVVAIIALAVGSICALNLRPRKAAFGRDPARSDAAPRTKEHGVDLQARRKTYDDVT